MTLKYLYMTLGTILSASACCDANGSHSNIPENEKTNIPASQRTVLVAYFSWSGTTQRIAEEIARLTNGTLFRIEPMTPYPSEYEPCTEVAKAERDENRRPAIKNKIIDFDRYDTIFIGCPVWWHTAPMIIHTFLEEPTYHFKGKTVIPFCTYAATYRDETLTRMVELTPDSLHLRGFGNSGDVRQVAPWLRAIGILPEAPVNSNVSNARPRREAE